MLVVQWESGEEMAPIWEGMSDLGRGRLRDGLELQTAARTALFYQRCTGRIHICIKIYTIWEEIVWRTVGKS